MQLKYNFVLLPKTIAKGVADFIQHHAKNWHADDIKNTARATHALTVFWCRALVEHNSS